MGITLSSKNESVDMGYGGFKLFRECVAFLASEAFGEHYSTLSQAMLCSTDEERETFFKNFNKKTNELIEQGLVSLEVVDFCFQSDCEGKIKRKQARIIYEVIKDYNDDMTYGYLGRSNSATFDNIKSIFEDSVNNGGKIEWY